MSMNDYPSNWRDIATRVKDEAGWKCVRCGHAHSREGWHVLTVHHLDGNKANCVWWNLLPLWRGLSAAGLAATLILGSILLTQTTPKPSFLVVLVAPQDKAPGWVIQASNSHEIQLIPLGVVEVPADKALEFWTKADGWQGPVSLGLVKPGEALSVPLDKLPPLQPNQLFELTLEGANGSPIGKPTGPIQAIGRAVKVL